MKSAQKTDPIIENAKNEITKNVANNVNKANGFFHVHYPQILNYLSGSTKNQQSLIWDYVIKRAITGSFVFLLFFGVTYAYGPQIVKVAENEYGTLMSNKGNFSFHPNIDIASVAYPRMYGWQSNLKIDVPDLLFGLGRTDISKTISVNSSAVSIANAQQNIQPVTMAPFIVSPNMQYLSSAIAAQTYESLNDLTDFYGSKVVNLEMNVGDTVTASTRKTIDFSRQISQLSPSDIQNGTVQTYVAFGQNIVDLSAIAYESTRKITQ